MRYNSHNCLSILLAALSSLVMVASCYGVPDWHKELEALKGENTFLKESLVEANKREEEGAKALAQVKVRLEAMGGSIWSEGDDRLLKAASDLEVLTKRHHELEGKTEKHIALLRKLLANAIMIGAEERSSLEKSMRGIEESLSYMQRPEARQKKGNINGAVVISKDSDSGTLVINAGDKENISIGMQMEVRRAGDYVGDVIVALTRADVSAALVQKRYKNNRVRVGDLVSLKR